MVARAFKPPESPDRATFIKANSICPETYDIYCSGLHMEVMNKDTRASYQIDVGNSTCTCKYYHNKGYCKHVILSLHHCNIDSSIIEVWRTFRYKGNTQRTKRMRGQTAGAAPALHMN